MVRKKMKPVLHLALAAAMILSPMAYATDGERIQLAAAIGSERKPATPPAEKTPPKPAPTDTATDSSFEGFETSTWIWIGVGAAALLAAAGGGGGGGGSSSQH